jgi:hypothetical protein
MARTTEKKAPMRSNRNGIGTLAEARDGTFVLMFRLLSVCNLFNWFCEYIPQKFVMPRPSLYEIFIM